MQLEVKFEVVISGAMIDNIPEDVSMLDFQNFLSDYMTDLLDVQDLDDLMGNPETISVSTKCLALAGSNLEESDEL